MSAVDFPPLSNLSAKFRPELRVGEDWPVTRLACDIFYGYRVISAYFLRTLCPRNGSGRVASTGTETEGSFFS